MPKLGDVAVTVLQTVAFTIWLPLRRWQAPSVSNRASWDLESLVRPNARDLQVDGGEEGNRTLGPVSRPHVFQTCPTNQHSAPLQVVLFRQHRGTSPAPTSSTQLARQLRLGDAPTLFGNTGG